MMPAKPAEWRPVGDRDEKLTCNQVLLKPMGKVSFCDKHAVAIKDYGTTGGQFGFCRQHARKLGWDGGEK